MRPRTVDHSEIERMFIENKSNRLIASVLQKEGKPISVSWIGKLRVRMGYVEHNPRKCNFSKEITEHLDTEKAMCIWSKGGTDRQIAGQCQVPVSRVVNWRDKNGLKENKRGVNTTR